MALYKVLRSAITFQPTECSMFGPLRRLLVTLKRLQPLGGLQAVDNLMPGFDKEIARTAQRLLINPRRIDYHTGVLATKVTPGVEIYADLPCTDVTAAHVVGTLPEVDDLPSPNSQKWSTDELSWPSTAGAG